MVASMTSHQLPRILQPDYKAPNNDLFQDISNDFIKFNNADAIFNVCEAFLWEEKMAHSSWFELPEGGEKG